MTSARDRHRPGELPWGWWLRACDDYLEDEQGRHWRSVREAFWQGELGFCDVYVAPEQHELMLRALSSRDVRWIETTEREYELFGGDMMFSRFYSCWLQSIGMLATTNGSGVAVGPLEAGLSAEGRSVLLMLRATRDPTWEELPQAAVVAAVAASVRGAAGYDREESLRMFENTVGFRRQVFARERIGRSYLITLTGLVTGVFARMPTRRVTWSLAFDDDVIRDDLFAWIATRIEHWDRWGEMAYDKGADAFTQHLLGMFVVSQSARST